MQAVNDELEEGDTLKITVVIPTRNRADTLKHCLASVLSEDTDDIEILVSDNASEDHTRQLVDSLRDERVTYLNTGKRVSMSDNWEFALNHVSTGMVTVIGDDDALIPGGISLVREIVSESSMKAVRANGCSYKWPSISDSGLGKLMCNLGRGYEVRSCEKWVSKVLREGVNYNELPVLYNGGYVHTDVLMRIKNKYGRYISSINPDVFLGFAIASILKSYAYSFTPLAVNGASHHSGGTAGFSSVKTERIYDPSKLFFQENTHKFHEKFPVDDTGKPPLLLPVFSHEAYLQATPNIDAATIEALGKAMVRQILVAPSDSQIAAIPWINKYIESNKFDISLGSPFQLLVARGKARLSVLLKKIKTGSSAYVCEGQVNGIELDNVLQSSIAAAEIISQGVSMRQRIHSLFGIVKRRLSR